METTLATQTKTIAIIGNPNVGKSSIFNQLTGLNQKIGNYPGVTVDKTVGFIRIGEKEFNLIDLPGTYSLYPKSEDEVIAHPLGADDFHRIGVQAAQRLRQIIGAIDFAALKWCRVNPFG